MRLAKKALVYLVRVLIYRNRALKVLGIVILIVLAFPASPLWAQSLVNSFETAAEVQTVQTSNAQVSQSTQYASQGAHSLQVNFLPVGWSKVIIPCPAGQPYDWSQTAGLAVDITNPNDNPLVLVYRVDDLQNLSGSATADFRSGHCTVEPHETETFLLPYIDGIAPLAYGMASLPYLGMYCAAPISGLNPFSASHIYDYQFSIQNVAGPTTLYFDNARTVAPQNMTGVIDQYGQSALNSWTGKITQDSDFGGQTAAEQTDINQHPTPSDRDAYGGWINGPTLAATGWFRTAQYQNRWWLVTQAGHLFFALGMDSVRDSNPTFTTGRASWFQWLPATSDPLGAYYGTTSGATQGPITSGTTYDFFQANLQRKYGGSFYNSWISQTISQLPSWGFNTIGNGSDSSTYGRGIATTLKIVPSGNFAKIPTGAGHGDQAPDPWEPNYLAVLDASLQQTVPTVLNDPYFLGYYVNNEMSFEGNGAFGRYTLATVVLGYPASTSYAKQMLISQIEAEYPTVTALNTAWGTAFSSWNDLSPGFTIPSLTGSSPYLTPACQSDLSALTLSIDRKYFQTVATELKKYDPNHLYLGCRFSFNYLTPEALQACAENADVISMNIYEPRLNTSEWGYLAQYNKPCMVGEFHMGAIDSGMYSPGLVAAPSQAGRAAMFTDYLQSALSSPTFVGVNWYQYVTRKRLASL